LSRDSASSSFGRLRAYLQARATLTPEELDFVRGLCAPRRLEKGDFLQRAGKPARYQAFVASGCLRSYFIDEQGKVHIVSFAPEDWWLSDSAQAFRNLTDEDLRSIYSYLKSVPPVRNRVPEPVPPQGVIPRTSPGAFREP
jgi:CRP-like cAMP-binding protein